MADVHFPTDAEIKRHFEDYCLAVGKVCYAWNFMHEQLLRVYILISGHDRTTSEAAWYSKFSDVAQRGKLRTAVTRYSNWPNANAQADFVDLLDKIDTLADDRNNAIHAPCTMLIGGASDGGTVMGAGPFSAHPRAQALVGKKLLDEFEWCEGATEAFSRFILKAHTALQHHSFEWPKRVQLPAK